MSTKEFLDQIIIERKLVYSIDKDTGILRSKACVIPDYEAIHHSPDKNEPSFTMYDEQGRLDVEHFTNEDGKILKTIEYDAETGNVRNIQYGDGKGYSAGSIYYDPKTGEVIKDTVNKSKCNAETPEP
jgi:predicted RNA methylase